MFGDEFDQFKRVHLVHFALDRYGYQRIATESSLVSHALRHPADDDKIIVRLNPDGHWTYFSVRDERDNGTILDFVALRERCSLGEVRKHLRSWLGTTRPDFEPYPSLPAVAAARAGDPVAVAAAFDAARLATSSPYLERRGLSRATLSSARFAGTWRVGPRDNVLFAHRDDAGELTGFELKNQGFTGFATGGTKSAWQSAALPTDRFLVVAEAPIDALSHHELHHEEAAASRYLSTAGAPSTRQMDLLDRVFAALPAGMTVVAAVDSDAAGTALAERLEALAGKHPHLAFRRDSPVPDKDWNDRLQRLTQERAAPPQERAQGPPAQSHDPTPRAPDASPSLPDPAMNEQPLDLSTYARDVAGYRALDHQGGITVLQHPSRPRDLIAVALTDSGHAVYAAIPAYERAPGESREAAHNRLRAALAKSPEKGSAEEFVRYCARQRGIPEPSFDQARQALQAWHNARKLAPEQLQNDLVRLSARDPQAYARLAQGFQEDRAKPSPAQPGDRALAAPQNEPLLAHYARDVAGYRTLEQRGGITVLQHPSRWADRVAIASDPSGKSVYAAIADYRPRAPDESHELARTRLLAAVAASRDRGSAEDFVHHCAREEAAQARWYGIHAPDTALPSPEQARESLRAWKVQYDSRPAQIQKDLERLSEQDPNAYARLARGFQEYIAAQSRQSPEPPSPAIANQEGRRANGPSLALAPNTTPETSPVSTDRPRAERAAQVEHEIRANLERMKAQNPLAYAELDRRFQGTRERQLQKQELASTRADVPAVLPSPGEIRKELERMQQEDPQGYLRFAQKFQDKIHEHLAHEPRAVRHAQKGRPHLVPSANEQRHELARDASRPSPASAQDPVHHRLARWNQAEQALGHPNRARSGPSR